LATTLEPKTPESPSNPLKTRIITYNPITSKKTLGHRIVSIVKLPPDECQNMVM